LIDYGNVAGGALRLADLVTADELPVPDAQG
jgi:hypothetical protein